MSSGLLCGKRLRPAIPHWLEHYEKHYPTLSDSFHEKLLRISPVSIDRVLKPFKTQYRRWCNTGTKSGTLPKNQIPIRTSTENIDRPGYLEADTVAHCGGSMNGNFIGSITCTDIVSTSTVTRTVWNKGTTGILEQTCEVEKKLPFAIMGIHNPNQTSFKYALLMGGM